MGSLFHHIVGNSPSIICACGASMEAAQKFCSECGTRAPARGETSPNEEDEDASRKRVEERFRTLLAKCKATDIADIVMHAILGADSDQTRDRATELVARDLSPEESDEFDTIVVQHMNL